MWFAMNTAKDIFLFERSARGGAKAKMKLSRMRVKGDNLQASVPFKEISRFGSASRAKR
jgi:hypothetical protein